MGIFALRKIPKGNLKLSPKTNPNPKPKAKAKAKALLEFKLGAQSESSAWNPTLTLPLRLYQSHP